MFGLLFKLFYSFFILLIALCFIILGLMSILLPFSETLKNSFILFVIENSIALNLFGFSFLIAGLLLMGSFYQGLRRQYYFVKSNPLLAVDEAVIHHYLRSYWEQKFPDKTVPTRLHLKKNKI